MYGNRPRVTPQEFERHVLPALSEHGFTHHQLEQVKAAFHEDFVVNPHLPSIKAGVDEHALSTTMEYMRAHPGVTAIGPQHWDKVQSVMEEYIQKRS